MYTPDPISDLLTRIRNARNARKDTVTLSYSKTKEAILKVMKDRKFIADYEVVKNGDFNDLEVTLNQDLMDLNLKQVSKPGQRIYVKSTTLKKVNGGLGVAIVSTSKGIMSGEEAQKNKLGGELICEVY